MQALRAHRPRQAQERLFAGTVWADNDLFFTNLRGGPLDPRRVHNQFKALLKQANLPPIRFHDLRHSFAELLLARPGVQLKDVQDLLGHSQISLTADLYSKIARERRADLAASMDDLLSGSK